MLLFSVITIFFIIIFYITSAAKLVSLLSFIIGNSQRWENKSSILERKMDSSHLVADFFHFPLKK